MLKTCESNANENVESDDYFVLFDIIVGWQPMLTCCESYNKTWQGKAMLNDEMEESKKLIIMHITYITLYPTVCKNIPN